jgi:hypothetical protein
LVAIFAQLAMGEAGVHGETYLRLLIGGGVACALLAMFFDRISSRLPSLNLPNKLQLLARPRAFLALLVTFAAITWLLDYQARVTVTSVPGGSYAAERQPETLPLIPTHARIAFPEGTKRGNANGTQENVWYWNTINTGAIMGEEKYVFERTYILIVFSKPTSAPQLFIYPTSHNDRSIPHYDIAELNERFAQIIFYGNLSGFDIDITNEKR